MLEMRGEPGAASRRQLSVFCTVFTKVEKFLQQLLEDGTPTVRHTVSKGLCKPARIALSFLKVIYSAAESVTL